MTTVEAFAPAKINLTLHVTGQRPDGYHLIDSLVGFADLGDTVMVRAAEGLTLTCKGPFGHRVPDGPDNLVLRAARLLDPERGAAITLIKRLPPSSGIGGGSADAAAALRALSALWDVPLPPIPKIAALGADVPVCLASGLTRMQGIGERLNVLGPTPPLGLVLVNPGVEVPTPAVFAALMEKENPAMPPMPPPGEPDWRAWMADQRNDLEEPAIVLHPVIGDVLDALRALPGCRLARMSGSGATCFALFEAGAAPDPSPLRARHPGWWVETAGAFPTVFS